MSSPTTGSGGFDAVTSTIPTEPRGLALYVGLDAGAAATAGVQLPQLVDALKSIVAQVVPDAESWASVIVAPVDSEGSGLDVVRRAAAAEPAPLATRAPQPGAVSGAPSPVTAPTAIVSTYGSPAADPRVGVQIDFSRNRVVVDDAPAALTFTEFEVLRYLVENEGRSVARDELLDRLRGGEEHVPGPRAVDVHVRRLRHKLGAYEDIVRTIRGTGYRFDPHGDVRVIRAAARA